MILREEEVRDEAILMAAREIMLAVRTAPKTRGRDNVAILVADGEERKQLAAKMDEINEKSGGKHPTFARDARGVDAAAAVLLIGVKSPAYDLNCGWCGFESCEAKNRQPAIPCVFGVIDLGIGSGVACARLTDKFIDNRLMYSIGVAAMALGWFPQGTMAALGLPLSVSGKNPYFDRK